MEVRSTYRAVQAVSQDLELTQKTESEQVPLAGR